MSEISRNINESTCYQEFAHWEYSGLLTTTNENHQRIIKDALVDFEHILPGGVAVVTVGSDGKMERYAQSQTELVLVCAESSHRGLREVLRDYCIKYMPGEDIEFAYDGLPGYFALDGETPFSFVHGNRRLVYPDFLLTSRLIVGDPAIWEQARQKVLDELADPILGRQMRLTARKHLPITDR